MSFSPALFAKFLTALAGVAAQAITLGLAVGDVAKWVTLGIGLITAVAVYFVPNNPAAPLPVVVVPPKPPAG